MIKKKAKSVLFVSFVVASCMSLVGCFEPDTGDGASNRTPEEAYTTGSRSYQLWTGNENHPENPEEIPWPNGQGPLGMGSYTCWPVSVVNRETGEVGDVAFFQANLYVLPGSEGSVSWRARRSFDNPGDDDWPLLMLDNGRTSVEFRNNSTQGQWMSFRLPVVDDFDLYSFNVAGTGGGYGFGLVPIYNQ